jgi:hypothetical protein
MTGGVFPRRAWMPRHSCLCDNSRESRKKIGIESLLVMRKRRHGYIPNSRKLLF